MARLQPIKVLRTTRANLNTQAGLSNLLAGEPYLITDENRFAVGLTTSTYADFAKLSEILAVASQSEMEAASATDRIVTPGRLHFHPGVAKCMGFVTVSAGVPTLAAGYNVASISDVGVGALGVTLTTGFSSGSYAVLASARNNVSGEEVTYYSIGNGSGFTISHTNGSGSVGDPVNYSFVCFGDF